MRFILSMLALALASTAFGAEIKLATVNMVRLYENYHVTQERNEKLQSAADKVQEQRDSIAQEGQVLVTEFQELAQQMDNPALSDDGRADIEAQARQKQAEIQAKQRELEQWTREQMSALQERERQTREEIIEEIKKVVMLHAGRNGATLVLDTSDVVGQGAPPILYADKSFDMTDAVLKDLNADAPAE